MDSYYSLYIWLDNQILPEDCLTCSRTKEEAKSYFLQNHEEIDYPIDYDMNHYPLHEIPGLSALLESYQMEIDHLKTENAELRKK